MLHSAVIVNLSDLMQEHNGKWGASVRRQNTPLIVISFTGPLLHGSPRKECCGRFTKACPLFL